MTVMTMMTAFSCEVTTMTKMLRLVKNENGQTKARQSHSRPTGLKTGVVNGNYTTPGAAMSTPTYRKIYCSIWAPGPVGRMKSAERDVLFHVLSSPQAWPIGCFPFSERLAATQMGLEPRSFRRRFGQVCATLGWRYDVTSTVLWAPLIMEWHIPINENYAKNWRSWFEDVPECGVKADAHASACRLLATPPRPSVLLDCFLGSPSAGAAWRRFHKSSEKSHEREDALG
jgi:hypothetical protein